MGESNLCTPWFVGLHPTNKSSFRPFSVQNTMKAKLAEDGREASTQRRMMMENGHPGVEVDDAAIRRGENPYTKYYQQQGEQQLASDTQVCPKSPLSGSISNDCSSLPAPAFTLPVVCTFIIDSSEKMHIFAIWLPWFPLIPLRMEHSIKSTLDSVAISRYTTHAAWTTKVYGATVWYVS